MASVSFYRWLLGFLEVFWSFPINNPCHWINGSDPGPLTIFGRKIGLSQFGSFLQEGGWHLIWRWWGCNLVRIVGCDGVGGGWWIWQVAGSSGEGEGGKAGCLAVGLTLVLLLGCLLGLLLGSGGGWTGFGFWVYVCVGLDLVLDL
jgi:hypothetical protein